METVSVCVPGRKLPVSALPFRHFPKIQAEASLCPPAYGSPNCLTSANEWRSRERSGFLGVGGQITVFPWVKGRETGGGVGMGMGNVPRVLPWGYDMAVSTDKIGNPLKKQQCPSITYLFRLFSGDLLLDSKNWQPLLELLPALNWKHENRFC